MDFVEIKHDEIENVSFNKSLWDCNVPPDLTIEGKDGNVFVHRAVLKKYSSLIEKKSCIKVREAYVEDLVSIMAFYYNGTCMVRQERLLPLHELSIRLGFQMLQNKVKHLINVRHNNDEQGLKSKGSANGHRNQATQNITTPEERALDSTLSSDTDTEDEDKDDNDDDDYSDAQDSDSSSYYFEFIKECIQSKPTQKNDSDMDPLYCASRVSPYAPRKQSLKHWTSEQNDIFVRFWLEELQKPDPDANTKMTEALAKTGLFVDADKLWARKHMFRKLYERHKTGEPQAYIKDYLMQLQKIYEIELLSIESIKDTSTDTKANALTSPIRKRTCDEAVMTNSSNVEASIVNARAENSSLECESDLQRISNGAVSSAVISNANSSANVEVTNANVKGRKKGRHKAERQPKMKHEMVNLMLKLWLKHARSRTYQGFRAIAREIAKALTEKGYKTTEQKVINKRMNLMRMYKLYKNGEHHSCILPYVPLIDDISAALSK